MTARPRFSIIVPVCHGGTLLKETIASLCALRLTEPVEFIIAAKDHASQALVKAAGPHVTMVVHPGNRAGQLNAACAQALGDWLVFIDDDCALPEDWISRLAREVDANPNAGIIGCADALPAGSRDFDVALDWVLQSRLGTGGCRRPGTSAGRYYPRLWGMVLRRDMALRVALDQSAGSIFDGSLTVHEDVELAERLAAANGEIHYAPDLVVLHHRDTTYPRLLKRNFEMARTSRRLGVHRLAHGALAGALLAAIALAALSPWWIPARGALLTAGATYAVLLALGGLAAWRATRRWRALPMTPALISSLHVARAAGYLFP